MSTLLNAIGAQSLRLGPLTHQAEEILSNLKAYPFERALKHDHKTEMEGDWQYEIRYYEKEDFNPFSPNVDISFSGPFCHFPELRPNNIEIGSFYNYDYLMRNKQLPWFTDYRRELYEVCQILGVEEVIYMADQSNFLGLVYQEWVIENWPYADIKKRILKRWGRQPRWPMPVNLNPMRQRRRLCNGLWTISAM